MSQKMLWGLVHLYCGDGKRKTTAAAGLVLRALACELNVVFVQFLKDGSSGEVRLLKEMPRLRLLVNPNKAVFSFSMNEQEKGACREMNEKLLEDAVELCRLGLCDLLVLDEVVGALDKNLLGEDILLSFLDDPGRKAEVVLTGRNPKPSLLERADYISEIRKIKHPFDRGVRARSGIEK